MIPCLPKVNGGYCGLGQPVFLRYFALGHPSALHNLIIGIILYKIKCVPDNEAGVVAGQVKKIVERIPLPDKFVYWGTLAGSLVAIIGFFTLIGVDWPLTEKSPVIQEIQEFDEIHELELTAHEIKIRRIRTKQLLDAIDSTRFILTQFEGRTDLNEGEHRIKVSLEGNVEHYLRELDEMAKGE